MTPILATAFVVHVLSGVIGVGLHNTVLLHLLKKVPNYIFVSRIAWLAVWLYFLSWATAAYYYMTYYGVAVKPRILGGEMSIAHTFFMETKQHMFLVLPFVSISIVFCTMYLRKNPDDSIRKSTAFLTGVALFIGLAVVASGILVSGSI